MRIDHSRAMMITSTLPIVAIVVALWGSTWGWNTDKKLLPLAPYYLITAYTVLLTPQLLLFIRKVRYFARSLASRVKRQGFLQLLWGLYTVGSSIALIHIFDSDALWLGSMGTFYIGYITTIFAVIKLLA